MSFSTGPAQLQDIAALAALEKSAFGEPCYPQFFFRQAYDLWPQYLWCVKDHNQLAGYQLAGYLLAAPMLNQQGVVNIMSVAIAPRYQGMGIGRLLVSSFLASQPQIDKFWLTVDPQNVAAQRLYQKLGFSVAKTENDYYHLGESRWLMEHNRSSLRVENVESFSEEIGR